MYCVFGHRVTNALKKELTKSNQIRTTNQKSLNHHRHIRFIQYKVPGQQNLFPQFSGQPNFRATHLYLISRAGIHNNIENYLFLSSVFYLLVFNSFIAICFQDLKPITCASNLSRTDRDRIEPRPHESRTRIEP